MLPASGQAFTSTVGGAVEASGNLDANNIALDPLWFCRVCVGALSWNGTNGVRGDLLNMEDANSVGAAYFMPVYVNATHQTKGSFADVWGQLNLSDSQDNSPVYREGNVVFGALTTDSKGAYGGAIEMQNTVTAGKPAKATVGTFVLNDNNPIGAYGPVMGASSPWAFTGSRGLWISSQGSQPAGTGVFLQGQFGHGLYVYQGNVSMPVVASRLSGEPFDRMQLLADGTLQLGDGRTAPTAKLIVQNGRLKFIGANGTVTTLAQP